MSDKGITFSRVGYNEFIEDDDTLSVNVDYFVSNVYFAIVSTGNNVGLPVGDARDLAKFILDNTSGVSA